MMIIELKDCNHCLYEKNMNNDNKTTVSRIIQVLLIKENTEPKYVLVLGWRVTETYSTNPYASEKNQTPLIMKF